jgi:glyoxylase-like metal-dependent hydrolase (beta-lactamase superfamily II)
LKIYAFEDGPVATIGYLVIDDGSSHALLVDCPPGCAGRVRAKLEETKSVLDAIVITHGHWDHTGSAQELSEATGAPVMIHTSDAYWLEDPMRNFDNWLPPMSGMKPHRLLHDGDRVECGALHFEVIHVPGHSQGSVALHEPDERVLFTGDALFYETIGRTDLYGGDIDTLIDAIKTRLLTLDDATNVYPGHGGPTTIGHERRWNQFLNS